MTMRLSVVVLTLAGTMAVVPAFPQAASGPRTFATPDEAAHALIDAAAKNDGAAMLKIFGPEGKDIVETGDPASEKQNRADFAKRAADNLKIEVDPNNPNRATMVVGR